MRPSEHHVVRARIGHGGLIATAEALAFSTDFASRPLGVEKKSVVVRIDGERAITRLSVHEYRRDGRPSMSLNCSFDVERTVE
jgi:hypothetical protein